MPRPLSWTLRRFFLFLGLIVFAPSARTAPFHQDFWGPHSIREPRGVTFEAVSILSGETEMLMPVPEGHPTLWFMPTDVIHSTEEIRVYYQRVEKALESYPDQRTWCVGFLELDGGWALPDLNLFETEIAGPNNLVLMRSPHTPTWGGFNVFQTVGDFDQGFRTLYWDQPPEGQAGALIASSTDGLHWIKETTQEAVFTEHNDAYSLVARPEEGDYLLYQTRLLDWPEKPFEDNLPGKRRVISLRRSEDLHDWTEQENILVPDEGDAPETEFYLMKVFRRGGDYAGVIMKYYGDPGIPGKHSGILRYELVLSPDGIHWSRPHREHDLEAWSYADPFLHDGHLCWVAYSKEGIVLHRVRRDGLASCGAEGAGSFWTRPFTATKEPLLLNADCEGGSIEVEVLDEKGQVLPGLERTGCRFQGEDNTGFALEWKGKEWSELEGRTIHLRFHLEKARVFSVYSME